MHTLHLPHPAAPLALPLPLQGRPKKGPEDKFRLNPVVPRLSELLGQAVKKVDDCIGAPVEAAVKDLKNGELLLLENVRFYPEEEKNESNFAKEVSHRQYVLILVRFIPMWPCASTLRTSGQGWWCILLRGGRVGW